MTVEPDYDEEAAADALVHGPWHFTGGRLEFRSGIAATIEPLPGPRESPEPAKRAAPEREHVALAVDAEHDVPRFSAPERLWKRLRPSDGSRRIDRLELDGRGRCVRSERADHPARRVVRLGRGRTAGHGTRIPLGPGGPEDDVAREAGSSLAVGAHEAIALAEQVQAQAAVRSDRRVARRIDERVRRAVRTIGQGD